VGYPSSWYEPGGNCVYFAWLSTMRRLTGEWPSRGSFRTFLLFKLLLGARGGPVHSSAVPYVMQWLSGPDIRVNVRTHPMFGREYQIAAAPNWLCRWMAKRTDWGQPELAVEKYGEYPAVWCWPGHAEYALSRPGRFVFMSIQLTRR